MNTDVRNRLVIFLGVLVVGVLFLLPTFFPSAMPKSWISKPISLGLDLSGGVHLVYQVQTEEAIKSRLQATGNQIRKALREAKIVATKARVNEGNQLEVFLLSDRSVDQAKQIIEDSFRRDIGFVERRDEEGRVKLVYGVSAAQAKEIADRAVNQAVETLRTRVDQFGVSEPLIQTAGDDRIILQMPGVSDVDSVKRVVGSVAKLEFRLSATPGTSGTIQLKKQDGTTVTVQDEVLMTGDMVETAQVTFPQGQFEVLLSMTPEGTRQFRQITTEHTGQRLAIILDNVVYEDPVIREPIPNGNASISGSFDEKQAKVLSVILRSGALPAPLKVVMERTVGPTLGKESIRSGVFAIGGGFLFIVIFMAIYYRKSGWVANLSLAINLFLMLALLSAFGATLTLPGLAGLALTLGMAVDSNVLIFERTREELRKGAGRDAAVYEGFRHAFTAIIDTHMTTLITAFILYFLGSGPIKGFAVTLGVGIVTTLYCATFASRLVFQILPLKNKDGALSI